MTFVCKYVALYVPDLRAAEEFYVRVFGMELLFRESLQGDGQWYALRPGTGWESDIAIDMVALAREEFVLALFRGEPQPGTVHEFCIGLSADEMAAVRERLSGYAVERQQPDLLFEDPFGFHWVVREPDVRFSSSGQVPGRWVG